MALKTEIVWPHANAILARKDKLDRCLQDKIEEHVDIFHQRVGLPKAVAKHLSEEKLVPFLCAEEIRERSHQVLCLFLFVQVWLNMA